MAKRDDFLLRQQAESDWQTKPETRAEFADMEQYFHYLKAMENGQVKILGKKL